MDIYSTNGQKILFTEDEIKCKATGIVKLAPGFVHRLIQLRETFGLPMKVNSCCRSKTYNATLGESSPHSFHVFDFPYYPTGGTCAIDISLEGKDAKYKDSLIKTALSLGWWVGIANSFLHLDRRVDYVPSFKTADRVFYYKGYKGKKYDDIVARDS